MDQDPQGDGMYQKYVNFGKTKDLFDWKEGEKY